MTKKILLKLHQQIHRNMSVCEWICEFLVNLIGQKTKAFIQDKLSILIRGYNTDHVSLKHQYCANWGMKCDVINAVFGRLVLIKMNERMDETV